MRSQILIEESAGVTTAALIEDGRLAETLSASPKKAQIEGNIYLGRVRNAVKGMDAAFVDVGLERTAIMSGDGLPRGKDGKRFAPNGGEALVQVTRLAAGDKGVAVSANIKLCGRYTVLLPMEKGIHISHRIEDPAEAERLRLAASTVKPKDMGLILRTNAQNVSTEEISCEIQRLVSEWEELRNRALHSVAPALLLDKSDICFRVIRDMMNENVSEVTVSSEALKERINRNLALLMPKSDIKVKVLASTAGLMSLYRVPSQIEEALKKRVWLKSGAFLVFDRTEALTVIDVNSGKFTGGSDADETARLVNLEAAHEIMRQLRLRDIGGIVIVDFIDMKTEEGKTLLMEAMRTYAKEDSNRTKVVDFTALGLMELTRKRKHEELRTYFGSEKTDE
ncbi:MAG: ribonuclease E/G [Clostridia bacterium]|nr:ribonuclease E/G [Clostridia bacterium]